ncbi:MAG: DUF1761 domain-containing protein [Caulobacter sp.]|nr:DUF1761 domain-containing protein [Caulobacter sp.]
MKGINWIGVLAALAASQAIGFIWYGMLFSAQWMALTGIAVSESEGSSAMALGAVQNLVVAIGLGWLIARTGMTGWVGGATAGLIACIFFGLATMSLRFIYGDDNTGLIPIDGGYMLIQYVVSGALIGGVRLGKSPPA